MVSGTVTSALPTRSTADPLCTTSKQEDGNLICTCQIMCDPNGDSGIGCDNGNCPYKWFHYKCVNIKRVPKGTWYCLLCRTLPEYKKRRTKSCSSK